MVGEQDGKILCQPVNLREVHKEAKEIAQKSRRAYKERTEAIKGKNELI